ncbi:MAG: ThiF family adenylyltransferase [Planctomycetota bacterium]|nr:MAG: ThiF family adenylyltransferase [Planctomycetota bacterium]
MTESEELLEIERDPELSRYSRQIFFEPFGREGQRKLFKSRLTLIGCGGLGTALASMLSRAGVGFLRIVDRDFIELNNLHRQGLYDEDDVAADLPKAKAACRKIRRINSTIKVEAFVADVNHRNIEKLAEGSDLLLDGTDNVETRFLINDLAVKTNRPWVYGACIRAAGMSMPILPHDTPCLRCIFEQLPPPEMTPKCATVGVLGPVVNMVASHQALEVIKILTGRFDVLNRNLVRFDAWNGTYSQHKMQKAYDEGNCPCCKQGIYQYLER